MTKRLTSFILALFMLITALPAAYAAEEETKPTLELPKAFVKIGTPIGTQTPFKPVHKYGSMQNSPDFTWPMISGAESYDLIVCSDEELTDVKYSKYGLEWHYYNFPYTFEPGTYYWAIRYHKGKEVSPWSAARRFRLDPDAYEFTVPDLNELADSVPQSHPRIWFTQDTIGKFKEKYNTEAGKAIVDMWIKYTESNMTKEQIAEPIPSDAIKAINYQASKDANLNKESQSFVSAGRSICQRASQAALSYIFTDDTRYADYAVETLLAVSDWDAENGATSFQAQDQAFFEIIKRASMVYDWMYNYMTEPQREKVRSMLVQRFDVIKDSSLETIRNSPYNSHIWSYFPNYGITCVALLHEVPEVEDYYKQFLPLYVANFVPMSKEDGGWSKGTAYWTYNLCRDEAFAEILKEGGYLDMYQKPWFQNEYLFAMYMMPAGSYGSFGDESTVRPAGNSYVGAMGALGMYTNNPVAIWTMRQMGTIAKNATGFDTGILYVDADNMEEKAPVDYPRAHVFIDQGMTAMHSDLMDKNRTSLYFRSGAYGSYNHMHADQNSFFIESHGERLATKSGWYDSYHSAHDSGFTRTTVAHNSITFDGGIGQKDDDIDANGNTDMFVTYKDFDAVVGDATKAYAGGLNKFVRSIIYVRPDSYIVVDDLEAATKAGSNFEWWLNGLSNVSMHEDGKGGAVTGDSGKSKLDVRVQYPEKVTGYYSNIYSGPNLINIEPSGDYTGHEAQQRIWFETERVKDTKMVTTMNVHSADDSGAYVKSTNGDNYIRLEFEDGTTAYVSTTTDENAVIKADELEFIGTAAVKKNNSIMLVGGTSLKADGKQLILSDRQVTVAAGEDMINVSSNDDYTISLGTGNRYISEIKSITDRNGRELSPLIGIESVDDNTALAAFNKPAEGDGSAEGGEAEEAESTALPENSFNIKAQKGHYSLLANGKPLPGQKSGKTIGLNLIIDGQKTEYKAEATLNPDYNLSAEVKAKMDAGYYYLVSKSDDVNVSGLTLSTETSTNISGEMTIKYANDGDYIELKSAKQEAPEVEYSEDYQGMKDSAAVVVEAENYDKLTGTSRLTQGVTFMTGISQMNKAEDTAEYTVDIPESGYYDLGVRYAAWQEPWPTRFIEINGTIYRFTCTDTGGYAGNGESDFDVVRIKSHTYLEAGKHKFTVMGSAETNTYWNVDWFAFLKTE